MSRDSDLTFCKNLLKEFLNKPTFPVTVNFKRSKEDFQLAERRQMKIFQPNRYVKVSCK